MGAAADFAKEGTRMREAEEDELDRWPVGLPGLERGVTRFWGRGGRSPAPKEVSRQGWAWDQGRPLSGAHC